MRELEEGSRGCQHVSAMPHAHQASPAVAATALSGVGGGAVGTDTHMLAYSMFSVSHTPYCIGQTACCPTR